MQEKFNEAELRTQAKACDYKVDGLARMRNRSVRTLERRFQAQFGCTPREWLNALKGEIAAQALSAGESPKAVAAGLGITDLANFCHMYQRAFGKSPRQECRLDITQTKQAEQERAREG